MRAPRRDRVLAEAGIDEVRIQEIDRDWLSQSPEQFAMSVLVPLAPDVVVEGEDFHFGAGRSGTLETLRELGGKLGFDVEEVASVSAPLLNQESVPVRSSVIRAMLEGGRVQEAATLLAHPWVIEGPVVQGDQRGRTIGCPTANLDHGPMVVPGDGVYGGVASCASGSYPVAVSVGTKPSFGHHARIVEAHLIGWTGPVDSYGWWLEVELHQWIRDQVRCGSIEELKRLIARDIDKVRSMVATVGS